MVAKVWLDTFQVRRLADGPFYGFNQETDGVVSSDI